MQQEFGNQSTLLPEKRSNPVEMHSGISSSKTEFITINNRSREHLIWVECHCQTEMLLLGTLHNIKVSPNNYEIIVQRLSVELKLLH